jgi:lysozyme
LQAKDGSELLGLDISEYQGITNADLLFSSMPHYIYLRAYGSNHTGTGDTTFVERANMARSYGVPCGAYYFGTPKKVADIVGHAQTEAQQFIDKLYEAFGYGDCGDIIPMLDIESYTDIETGTAEYPKASGMTGDELITWVKAFRDYFWANSDRRVGFYSNRYFLEDATQMALTTAQLQEISDMPLWLAEYDQWYGGETGNVQPLDLGGWTMWWLWQYTQNGVATDYGLSHGQNQVDINRTKDISWLMPPPQSNDFTLTDEGGGSLRIDFTHPNVVDYIGASVYINGTWQVWMADGVTTKTLHGLPVATNLSVQLVTEDNGHDLAWSDPKAITLADTGTGTTEPPPATVEESPVVTITSLELTKISDEAGFSSSDITFQFDIPVIAYTVRCTGTSHDSGIDVGSKDKYVRTTANMTVLEASAIAVADLSIFPALTDITEVIDYTELYAEGTNKVNVYGQSEGGLWTPYNQA